MTGPPDPPFPPRNAPANPGEVSGYFSLLFAGPHAEPTPSNRVRDYHLALGEFVATFSLVETMVYLVLRHYSNVPPHVANSLLSGIRIRVIKQDLGRLYEAGTIPKDKWDDLKPILDQLGEINGRRDSILHFGAEDIAAGNGIVSNAIKAHTSKRVRSFPISAEILREMTDDLYKIMTHFTNAHLGRDHRHPTREPAQVERILQRPWRYKPPPQLLSAKKANLGQL